MALIDDLQWRYIQNNMTQLKKVSQEDVDKIVEAARLAPLHQDYSSSEYW
jgi:nitroreductase